MDDYRTTVTMQLPDGDERELIECSERVLDQLVDDHPDLGPVTDVDRKELTFAATVAYDAAGLEIDAAVRRGTDIVSSAVGNAGVGAVDVVDVHLTRVTDREVQLA